MNAQQENTTEFQMTAKTLSSAVKRFGQPASSVLLNSPSRFFQIPQSEEVIGYQLIGNCAVVIGDPLCSPQNIPTFTHAFHQFCQKNQWTIVYLLASECFAHWAIGNGCPISIQVGEELIVGPINFQIKQKLRWKMHNSVRHGVIVKEYCHTDSVLENKMESAAGTWLKEKNGPQIYLGKLNGYDSHDDKRIFYALQEEKIVGLAALSRLDKFQGWVLTYFFAVRDAPAGVTEHLLISAIETLANENCPFLCLGVVSGSNPKKIAGLNIISRFLIHLIFRISRSLFHLDARKMYFNKYKPKSNPTYILCSRKLGISELMALKKILNVKL